MWTCSKLSGTVRNRSAMASRSSSWSRPSADGCHSRDHGVTTIRAMVRGAVGHQFPCVVRDSTREREWGHRERARVAAIGPLALGAPAPRPAARSRIGASLRGLTVHTSEKEQAIFDSGAVDLVIIAGVSVLVPLRARRLPLHQWQAAAELAPRAVGGADSGVIGKAERDQRFVGSLPLSVPSGPSSHGVIIPSCGSVPGAAEASPDQGEVAPSLVALRFSVVPQEATPCLPRTPPLCRSWLCR